MARMIEEYEAKAIEYSRGKIAGHEVRDKDDNLIVAKGDRITDEAIEKARKNGKLHYLMISAASGVVQEGGAEAKRRLDEFKEITEGHESDFVLGKKAPRDVKAFDGDMLAKADEVITQDIVDHARDMGVLQELVLAVGAPGLHSADYEACGECEVAEEMEPAVTCD